MVTRLLAVDKSCRLPPIAALPALTFQAWVLLLLEPLMATFPTLRAAVPEWVRELFVLVLSNTRVAKLLFWLIVIADPPAITTFGKLVVPVIVPVPLKVTNKPVPLKLPPVLLFVQFPPTVIDPPSDAVPDGLLSVRLGYELAAIV
jgi:hypothetical protein